MLKDEKEKKLVSKNDIKKNQFQPGLTSQSSDHGHENEIIPSEKKL